MCNLYSMQRTPSLSACTWLSRGKPSASALHHRVGSSLSSLQCLVRWHRLKPSMEKLHASSFYVEYVSYLSRGGGVLEQKGRQEPARFTKVEEAFSQNTQHTDVQRKESPQGRGFSFPETRVNVQQWWAKQTCLDLKHLCVLLRYLHLCILQEVGLQTQ